MSPSGASDPQPRVAVVVPCHDEATTIGKVVDDFRRELPGAEIHVFDNRSTDATARIAAEHGAIVHREPRQGKGFVVESIFDRIDADIYVLVDGDDTYCAERVRELVDPVARGAADMVVGARLTTHTDGAFRPFHVAGNTLVRFLVNRLTGSALTDIMSGYRALSRAAVRKIPVVSAGFEVETEMTLQMLYYQLAIVEVPLPYRPRPEGSASKLRTFRDGFRVLYKIFTLFRSFKPLTFFGGIGLLLFVAGVAAGAVPVYDYVTQRAVRHLPLAVLATGLVLLSGGFVFLGIHLHAINWRFRELHNVLTRRSR